ncbi:hypothetical protein JG688_00012305 [Phytophthora aleatoria]|uniref:VPS9 domain-containing protein n=1 Tax=Phytophthora aleatoria TaxID=2496075 RepID=A0A8J5M4Q4_9STRA|nr:hypothetical protein JG688_00012305 [Phytophthora aleatoria]
MAGKTPSLPHTDSGPPVSARDASYWLAVACAPSSSRSGAVTSVSASSSTRSLDASSFLLSLRSNSNSSVLDSNKSLLELRGHTILPQQESLDVPPPSSLYDSSFYAPTRLAVPQSTRTRNKKQNQRSSGRTESKKPVIVAEEVLTPSTSSSAFDDAFLDSMSGWLRKRGHVRKNWKARYFVLEKSVLRYYADSSCTKLKGEVLLFHPQTRVHYVDVHVAGGRDASFAIQVGPDYTLLLQAAQLRDRENWMYCIEDALLCRDSYHPQRRPGPYFDLRESVAQRRLLSAEAMALDGSSFRDNLGGISHAHGGAVSDELSDEEDCDDQSASSSYGQRSGSGGDVLRLWASLHAKPGGVLSAVSSASPTLRSLLRACDQYLASLTMRQHIASFLVMFRQKYEHPATSSVTAMGASAWTRLSEPWAPGLSGNESDSDQELREGSLGATPQELHNVTTLQDARSLLALKNYRFFLERSLELIMEHLSTVANPNTPRQLGDSALNGKRAPTDDEWALARRATLYKLERRTFIPLQEVIYQLLGAGRGQRQEEEERFERLRALVASQPQSFLEIQPSHQSPSEWKSAVALLNCMDNYSLPSEKAAVLVEVARCIYETHAREHGFETDSTGKSVQPTLMAADDFLPIFIFVLARCQLRSVIVARHLISETMITALMIGETGYYATMLEAAIGYIAAFDGAAKVDEMATRNTPTTAPSATTTPTATSVLDPITDLLTTAPTTTPSGTTAPSPATLLPDLPTLVPSATTTPDSPATLLPDLPTLVPSATTTPTTTSSPATLLPDLPTLVPSATTTPGSEVHYCVGSSSSSKATDQQNNV